MSCPEATVPVWQPLSSRRIGVGVVGGRFGASFHWHEHPNCQVIAVCERDPERAAHLRQRYDCEQCYPEFAQLLSDERVEAVAIFSGAPDHAWMAIAAMTAGKHVFSAVPACLTLDEARQLAECKLRTGRTYMMAETSFYRWETILMRRLYRAGALGELVYTEGEYYHPMTRGERDGLWFAGGERTWRYALPPMLYPTHTTGFLVGVTGERLTHVSCVGWGADEPALADNAYDNPFLNGCAMFRTSGGHAFRGNTCWRLFAHGERAQWFGTEGSLFMPGWSGQPGRLVLNDGRTFEELPDYWPALPEAMHHDSGHGRSHPFLTNEFISALLEEREPACNLWEALAMTVPGIVSFDSARQGGAQLPVPCFDPPGYTPVVLAGWERDYAVTLPGAADAAPRPAWVFASGDWSWRPDGALAQTSDHAAATAIDVGTTATLGAWRATVTPDAGTTAALLFQVDADLREGFALTLAEGLSLTALDGRELWHAPRPAGESLVLEGVVETDRVRARVLTPAGELLAESPMCYVSDSNNQRPGHVGLRSAGGSAVFAAMAVGP